MPKIIYLKMEPYLRQWFIHENEGKEPVSIRRGSPEMNIFRAFIAKKPAGWTAEEEKTPDSVAIIVPQFKMLDAEYWCYLPPRAKQALYNCIKACLDVQLFQEIHVIRQQGLMLRDLVYAFMEKHGIEDTETNWNTLSKIYKRKLDSFSGNPTCITESEHDNHAQTEKTVLTFQSVDELPINRQLAFVVSDVCGRHYIIGHFEDPFPTIKRTQNLGTPGDEKAGYTYEVTLIGRKTLIQVTSL